VAPPTDHSPDQAITGAGSLLPAHDPALVDALAQLDPSYRLPTFSTITRTSRWSRSPRA